MHFHTSSPTGHNVEYHAALHKHVATPHDKHSPLYIPDLWIWHDLYDKQLSYASPTIVTRSQTAFNRIEINDEEMKFFQNGKRHHPPNLPHLMLTMKDGVYGALPRTIVTRSMTEQLEMNPTLMKTIQAYESFQPMALRPPPLQKPVVSAVVEPLIESKRNFPQLESVKKEKESEPDPIDSMAMSDSTDDNEEEMMEQEKILPVHAEKPLRGSNTVSCMTMCLKKKKKSDPYLPSGKQAALTLDESVKNVETQGSNPFFSVGKPPLIPSQESLKSASSLEGFPKTPNELSLPVTRNPFSFSPSNCSQESSEVHRESVRYIKTLGSNPFFSGCKPQPIPSQESLKSASSLEGFPKTPNEPSLPVTRNPFSFTPSNCSQESIRGARESRRPFPSLSSLGSIGFRSPSPNSRAAVTSLHNQMQNLSMGPKKTIIFRRLQV